MEDPIAPGLAEITQSMPQSSSTYQYDPHVLVDYLVSVLVVVLGIARTDLETEGSFLSLSERDDTHSRCLRFVSEPQTALYIQKHSHTRSVTDNRDDLNGTHQESVVYTLSSQITRSRHIVACIAILKRPAPITTSIPVHNQLSIVNLSGAGAWQPDNITAPSAQFEALHDLVQFALTPYFDACTHETETTIATTTLQSGTDAKSGITSTKRKLVELELGLRSLQQDSEIPELHLVNNAQVQSVLDRAYAAGHEPSISQVPIDLLTDTTFLNTLQAIVNGWIKAIQSTVQRTRDPAAGTAMQEKNFWLSMQNALAKVSAQQDADGVKLTLDILRNAKRHTVAVSFHTDTGLTEAIEDTKRFNAFLRDIPIEELVAATSLDTVQIALQDVFYQLNKKLRQTVYPMSRALPLVSAISADLDTRLRSLLDGQTLMQLQYSAFQDILDVIQGMFDIWDDQCKDFMNLVREVLRKTSEKFAYSIKIEQRHKALRARLDYVNKFRSSHEQFRTTIANVLDDDDMAQSAVLSEQAVTDSVDLSSSDAITEIQDAYSAFDGVDVLDTREEGTALFTQAENAYDARTSRVENIIITRLRDRLATAKTSNEMFRVLSRFNALFTRPKIRGAVAEYQTQLMGQVTQDVLALHERFKHAYGHTETHAMSQLRDLPPVSGAIIRYKQIERQLDRYMTRVEDILGQDWALYGEGQKLHAQSYSLRVKLDTKSIYDEWLRDVFRRNVSVDGRLFSIARNRANNAHLDLVVRFDPQAIILFKEVRNLSFLGFQAPQAISASSKAAQHVYPYTVSLMESVGILMRATASIGSLRHTVLLVSKVMGTVQELVAKGVPLQWQNIASAHEIGASADNVKVRDSKHVQYFRDFARAVQELAERVSLLVDVDATLQRALQELEHCPYDAQAFGQQLYEIQKAIDRMGVGGCVNLGVWIAYLNTQVADVLCKRLQRAIQLWIATFVGSTASEADFESHRVPEHNVLRHDIVMRNQTIYLDPPLQSARVAWTASLHQWLRVICSLPRLRARRFGAEALTQKPNSSETFQDLLEDSMDSVVSAFATIEEALSTIDTYVREWLQYQSLWDLQMDAVQERLSENLSQWLQLLQEVRLTRETFDTTETNRVFPQLMIGYEQAQLKISARYDQWQRDLIIHFAQKLADASNEAFVGIKQARKDLEAHSIDTSSTNQAVNCITTVQSIKQKVTRWEPEIRDLSHGQRILSRQRFHFPSDWLHHEQLDHEWTALVEALMRKSHAIETQVDVLRTKVTAEDKNVTSRIEDMTTQWADDKPVSGQIPPKEAMATLTKYDHELGLLRDQLVVLARAKEALDMPLDTSLDVSDMIEEVQDFKAVWTTLSTVYDGLEQSKTQAWVLVYPRKLKQTLESLLKMTKDMPSRMRQYAAFEHLQSELRLLLRINPVLTDLKSDAIQERHWTKLLKAVKPSARYVASSFTLGDVYDLRLEVNGSIIKAVLAQAQGEMALEEYIRLVRETWSDYSLDLVNYQSKCRLIRGWDDLFAKCSEQLNALQAMQHSAYYKQFEEEATLWVDKLNKVQSLFDVWISVQRQWVYLEGVFTGNVDIRHLLPTESNRFNNINNEFMLVLKQVSKSPLVLDVLNIPGVQKSLERLADQLQRIQKALGEYLERERSAFPRFYFVGDEDLLEIIGNSNDPFRISKHLPKMFAGISSLIQSEPGVISGVASREGEQITLELPVVVAQAQRVNQWLAMLEQSLKETIAHAILNAFDRARTLLSNETVIAADFEAFVSAQPTQVLITALQLWWTEIVEQALSHGEDAAGPLQKCLHKQNIILQTLATAIAGDLDQLQRKRREHLIPEVVHQRDGIEKLINCRATSTTHFLWQVQMRYYTNPDAAPLQSVEISMANASIGYGFEYLGMPDRLVRTPLTDRCFLTLMQALRQRLGGSPYGPAGTGKTETVKALGVQLGRLTIVFNCDDTFDFQSMGRIFLGISQVGAWGCFDEFNRLEERILSAVSQQIQDIQLGLRKKTESPDTKIVLHGREVAVHPSTGMFITMNPNYAGRSNLPDNLKKLFRSVAMTVPDKELIAEVMLYSQGFSEAEPLSRQIVPFFDLCAAQLSAQPHYDFGLRALKSVLVSAGIIKRTSSNVESADAAHINIQERQIVVQSIRETVAPKLVDDDAMKLGHIQEQAFPGIAYIPAALTDLRKAISATAQEQRLTVSDAWLNKIIEIYHMQKIHHGLMVVGSSGTGKSSAWQTLLSSLQIVDGIESVSYVIDPKVMSKEDLYGKMDSTTREWTDGLFTGILRKITDDLRGESVKRHWIVFDGDVDPEWVENLNSVLDDNRLLTLPNGERLAIPSNVRIVFEVESLKHATLATVSRCGMIWFSNTTMARDCILDHHLAMLRAMTFEELEIDNDRESDSPLSTTVTSQVADVVAAKLRSGGVYVSALKSAAKCQHIMQFSELRALMTLFSLMRTTCRDLVKHNFEHADFSLEANAVESYATKKLALALVWAMVGDCPLTDRKRFGDEIVSMVTLDVPVLDSSLSLLDYGVELPRAQWLTWQSRVPAMDLSTHAVTRTDLVIPTVDTIRHEDVLYARLAEHKPLLLCGPPGSGKTMTLLSALRKLPSLEVVALNFSSATTTSLLLNTLEQYCAYRKTVKVTVMAPTQLGRWLVIFCDEVNLPTPDRYGTQRVISLMRQLVEKGGFWRPADMTWISLERVQFVGACNPPTDAGRTPLTARFLRHAALVMVDYPGEISLRQIYGALNTAVLKITPSLRGFAEDLTNAMIELYTESQQRFTADIQPHYIYSPRELTRWVKAIYEAIRPLDSLPLEGLVRLWTHEAMRLFNDRLVTDEERQWTGEAIDRIAKKHFPSADHGSALQRPILYSDWLSRNYVAVEQNQLREFVRARLSTFCEEELDVPLILYDDLLEHALRIDRVFKQPQGHLILIGVSGSGKTTMSRFVAWMNGLSIFQIKVSSAYSAADFDEDLRNVLRRTGCKGEKICFILDESNVLDSAFLERMNTVLANGEIPGLFEGDEYTTLMTACKESSQRQGLLLDSMEELYKWFTAQVVKNLHVVFTMNPPKDGLASRAATSPALFNRCVLDWYGDWSDRALFQVAHELTQSVDLDRADYVAPEALSVEREEVGQSKTHREAVVDAMVYVHRSIDKYNERLRVQQGLQTFLTPRHYLDFVEQYSKLYDEKRTALEDEQRHLNVGLDKLRDTVREVDELSTSLASKRSELERKDSEANEKLQGMLTDQGQAEKRKVVSLEVREALAKQDVMIAERRDVVERDLAEATPAVEDAQRSVNNIKKQHLTELRSMQNPPAGVKLALESVCTLLGHKTSDWRTIISIIRRDDFIPSIVHYDNETQMTPAHRSKMEREYLSQEDFTYERVNRASKACGPLVQWVEAQVHFSGILSKVGPLRAELDALQDHALQTRAEAQAIENEVIRLETRIATLKSEYRILVSEVETIKGEMVRVQTKVERSSRLLASLDVEKQRWHESSDTFDTQLKSIAGDVFMAAALITYGGLYDQQYRAAMLEDWSGQLASSGIDHKEHNPIGEYLSTAGQRHEWQDNGLPVDELCTENAIMLQRYNRYPLIIDPTGRITSYIQKQHQGRRLTVTSFLDQGYTKLIESALRFGNPVLIQDAEHLDPILNHVLNKEYQKTGGRILVQLGRQEIDFSPSFKLYLITRDSSKAFAPDVCSRTSFVNFTVTPNSMRQQALNDIIKSERPEINERRTNLVKVQGEFRLRLQHLEKELLDALNATPGNILDNDKVLDSLETLKREAEEIAVKAAETEGVMAEIEQITKLYRVVAQACSAIYAVLERMHHLNHFYQFSLQYFLDIFHDMLASPRIADEKNDGGRIQTVLSLLFSSVLGKTLPTLLQRDRTTFAMLLAQAWIGESDSKSFDNMMDASLKGEDLSRHPERIKEVLATLNRLPQYKQVQVDVESDDWQRFLHAEDAEVHVPSPSSDTADDRLREVLLVRLFRTDRLIPSAERFMRGLFKIDHSMVEDGLEKAVQSASALTPIAMNSSPGFDASYKVDQLVSRRNMRCISVAMGSNEAGAHADAALREASTAGTWVFIKNVHLAPAWLQNLEKRIESLRPHVNFRLILSMESTPLIPANLLRRSRILTYEQPAGIKASMRDTQMSMPTREIETPVEKTRVCFLLSYLHAVISERLRYAPKLGWSGRWEFNDSDFECAMSTASDLIETVSRGRSNIAPQAIPWELLRVLVTETYGGKVDSAEDFAVLGRLVSSLLTPATFEEDFDLVKAVNEAKESVDDGAEALLVPSGSSKQAFADWVSALPDRESPTCLGLAGDAEKLLLVAHADEMIHKTQMMLKMLDEGEAMTV